MKDKKIRFNTQKKKILLMQVYFLTNVPGDGRSDSLPVVVILKDRSGKVIDQANTTHNV